MASITSIPRKLLSMLTGQHFEGERDLYKVFGYPRALGVEDFRENYLRGDIAARIVDAYPDATWREPPDVLSRDETFRSKWAELVEDHNLYKTLHRLDKLCGLGHYSVLLVGVSGGEALDEPLKGGGNPNLLFLAPYGEYTAQIVAFDSRAESPRFGMPERYRLTIGADWPGITTGKVNLTTHHSRVVHIAENSLEDTFIGVPRMERIWNRLMDLDKLLGGSAEVYWQNAAQLLAFIADADVEWDPEEKADMATQLEELQHGMRRHLRLRGVTPENIAAGLQGVDPGPYVDKQLDILAGATGIPKRILIGSERGELASSQDETAWANRIGERREQFATPMILKPLIDKLQRVGILPAVDFEIRWPDSDTLGEEKRATIGLTKAQALKAYMESLGGEEIVPVAEFRTQMLGLEPEPEGGFPELEEEEPEETGGVLPGPDLISRVGGV